MHRPGRPKTPAPSSTLRERLAALDHPAIANRGVTTTADGEWAMLVRVHQGPASIRQALIEQAREVPIVVEVVGDPPLARPAFPVDESTS